MIHKEQEPLLGYSKPKSKMSGYLIPTLIFQTVVIVGLCCLLWNQPQVGEFAAYESPATKRNDKPIIGLLTQPLDDVIPRSRWPEDADAYVPASYQKWIEAAGGRVVIIHYGAPKDEIRRLFKSVNGLLIPGGDQLLYFNTTFMETAKLLYDLAMESNDAGNFFPIWGTCMGMQLLTILTSGNPEVLRRGIFTSEDISLTLDLTHNVKHGRLLGRHTPNHIMHAFQYEPITANFHHDGIFPDDFVANRRLNDFYHILAVNNDLKGVPFVSMFEGKRYPFYGVQFHPETNQFSFSRNDSIVHTPSAVRAMQYLANFFIDEARKNFNSFESPFEEQQALIYRYNASFRQSIYFFPKY